MVVNIQNVQKALGLRQVIIRRISGGPVKNLGLLKQIKMATESGQEHLMVLESTEGGHRVLAQVVSVSDRSIEFLDLTGRRWKAKGQEL